MASRKSSSIYKRIREILESARASVARSVNTTQVVANWLVGREIVEEEQKGRRRAGYGERLVRELAGRLRADYETGYNLTNLKLFRKFYLEYPRLADGKKGYALRDLSWKPERLHHSLSWTHYRTLLRVDKPEARGFYEIEAIKNNWSARELERQINSLLHERLALSKDKRGLMTLATKGHAVQQPADVFKDPVVMEFLGMPESPRLVETDLEQALINNLQSFLLELGKGFAFVARQERLTLDGDHFYIDLVFYHTILKCYVIIDLKTGKLTHQDLGQTSALRELLRPRAAHGRGQSDARVDPVCGQE
jgi:predicted nuclease of restriction endonuclease-like (RecB) superfamily